MTHNKNKKLYTVVMTGMQGTYVAGKFYGRDKRECVRKAKKFNGPDWTYYIMENNEYDWESIRQSLDY